MTPLRRIASGTAASAVGVVLLAIAQIASVPVLTSCWGLERYGVWVMLTTIPGYLALSDLGFASAATSKMTAQFARDEVDQVRCTFQSVWLLNSLLSSAVIISATVSIWLLLPQFPQFYEERAVFAVLVIYSTLIMNARVWLGAFRATHNYAVGTLLYDGWISIETLASLLTAHLGGDLVSAAMTMLCARLISSTLMWLLLRRYVPWLTPGIKAASLAEIKRLASPAFGALAIPVALAINLQGTLLLAGLAISPIAAATLGAVRTVTRSAIQVVAVVNRATMPELAAAWTLKRSDLFRHIVVANYGSLAVILLPASAVFAIFGDSIIDIWTAGRIHVNANFILLMALALPIHGYWFFTLNLLLASNKHTRISFQLAVLAVVTLIPTFVMAKLFNLNGIAGALLVFETVSSLLVTHHFRRAYSTSKESDVSITVAR